MVAGFLTLGMVAFVLLSAVIISDKRAEAKSKRRLDERRSPK